MGSTNFAPYSTSPATGDQGVMTVNRATPLSAITMSPPAVQFAADGWSTTPFTPITINMFVVPPSGVNTRPSGTVAFYNAQTGQLLAVVGLPTSGPTTGVAQFTIAGGLSLGNYTFFVAYSGDQDFAA